MQLYLRFAATLVIAVFVCGHQTVNGQQSFSRKELHVLIKTAHTDEEYGRLETYYREQSKKYRELAHIEHEEMAHALKANLSSSKFPTAYDRARNLQIYFIGRAEQAAALAKNYKDKRHDEAARDTEPGVH